MTVSKKKSVRCVTSLALVLSLGLVGGCDTMSGMMGKMGIGGSKTTAELKGENEVPPVTTKASGRSTITVADDRTVSGSVLIDDMTANAAHIHRGAKGENGPVILPLTKTSDKAFSVPANARLTESQFADYKAGNLYVNVHSPSHPGGEIRVQLKP
ncbi:CHRD domain-containing protein [Noviherbaspirillum malthae]|uniref:CHRD domain-containing protein n=1 Tax=Noviherbaspirillum malthae TaxID=1260987 RepID=UPI00188F8EED|nr:CHRD domain-containing protein [Noviherbaspirillum malthae]